MPGQAVMPLKQNQVSKATLATANAVAVSIKKSMFSGVAQFYKAGSSGSGAGSVSNSGVKARRT